MREFEYTPSEDAKFDHLLDFMNVQQAEDIIRQGRVSAVSNEALSRSVSYDEKPRPKIVDHRGGRAYPTISDSEADPHWGEAPVQPVQVQDQEASDEGFRRFAEEGRRAAATLYAQQNGTTIEQAEALLRIKRERQRRNSSAA